MPFTMTLTLEEPRVKEIISCLREILIRYHRSFHDENLRDWYKKLLDVALRQLEIFISATVSEKAEQRASEMELGSLIGKKYADRDKFKDAHGKKVFHFEHVLPVRDIFNRLVELSEDVTEDQILNVVQLADIAWVLVEEDNLLTARGYRSKRDKNPCQTYQKLGIKLVKGRATAPAGIAQGGGGPREEYPCRELEQGGSSCAGPDCEERN